MDTNVLYYGDNLHILRHHIPDNSVDLIYLDPPFNSQATYNLLFREETGASSDAQIEAFEDTWHWGDATGQAYDEVLRGPQQNVARMLKAMVDGLGHNQVTAYLSMMAIRLVELHRTLKPSGAMYLHCDPTAGHYLKSLLDGIFDPRNFLNEIVWKRSSAHSDRAQGAKHFGRVHDSSLVGGARVFEVEWHACRLLPTVWYLGFDQKFVPAWTDKGHPSNGNTRAHASELCEIYRNGIRHSLLVPAWYPQAKAIRPSTGGCGVIPRPKSHKL